MGRFNKVTQENESKIKELESELAKMKEVVDNLNQEKELALKFNQLLLAKLNGVDAVELSSLV